MPEVDGVTSRPSDP